MDDQNFYVLAYFRIRAQTEQDMGVRWAVEALICDYARLAEGRGTETALTADFESPTRNPLQERQ